jgi:hypothetical protein
VALYFASQSPSDIPAAILGQLGNRIQHGLRGATAQDLRAIRAAAETMPINPAIDAGAAIVSLGVGQALVSTVAANGVPSPVEIVHIARPRASLAPIDQATREAMTPRIPASASGASKPHPGDVLFGRSLLLVFVVLPALIFAADIFL